MCSKSSLSPLTPISGVQQGTGLPQALLQVQRLPPPARLQDRLRRAGQGHLLQRYVQFINDFGEGLSEF